MLSSWEVFKYTILIRLYCLIKIPLLGLTKPVLLHLDDQKTVLKIPLCRRTKNHLHVMYFGGLAMGAEAAVAIKAIHTIHHSKKRVDFLFKDFKADFLKRAEGDVHFICEEGFAVKALVEKTITTGERQTQTFRSYAIVPSRGPEPIAEFLVSLSVKYRK